jgi:archaellum component FlaG (FlaF/FlaG flagellin family)
MQTRTYGDLFSLISNMIGAVELAADEQTQVKNFINRRFQEAFDTSPVWPRYLVSSEERQIIALTLSGATSSTSTSVNQNYKLLGSNTTGGTNVYQGVTTNTVIIYNTGSAWRVDTSASATEQADGTYTVSAGTQQFIEADTNKKDNVEDVETWTPRSGSDVLSVVAKQLIPYAETNRTNIGDFNRIHRKKAFLNNSAIEYDFFADADGANILNIISTTDNTAFVTYKKQFTPFSVTTNFYNSTAEVPAEFFNYIAHTVYADFLRVQNKQEEAIAEENVGAKYLAQELEKVDLRMNNSTINKRFSTYVNRQSR